MPNLALTLDSWIPELYEWQAIENTDTNYDGCKPLSFLVDTVDLPTASKRWKVDLPAHADVTFDSLTTGKWPLRTEEELKARRQAIAAAKTIRPLLDIRPLKTSTIIRYIRKGRETSND